MSVGLLALLDDVAAFAKVAAASLDDIGAQAIKAGSKAAGVVIDDAAVTPRYVVGFAAERELSIVGRIAKGSLKNKLIFLLPAALAISFFVPWLMTPLLMIGGAYLCFEGAEKVFEALFGHHGHPADTAQKAALSPQELEDQTVAGAIKTDFILSAEIMAITLSSLPEGNVWTQALILAAVAIGITVVVYGAVALIVKADDVGISLAARKAGGALGGLSRAVGRGLVIGMPVFLKILSIVGTAAMVWVGGGIIVHGLEGFGFGWLGHGIHDAALAASGLAGPFGGLVEWLVTAAASGVVGLILGGLLIPLVTHVFLPLWSRFRGKPTAPVEAGATPHA
jgi:predicted DNA repair protein MutK